MEEQIKTFDVDFGEKGNWGEVATSIPLFMCMVVNGLNKTVVDERDIDKLQNYSGKMTYNLESNTVTYELVEKVAEAEIIEEEVVEESN